jgi:WD40 repeat protein
VASAADDNSIRIWSTATGLPQPFFGDISGNPVEKIVFSPDAAMLGLLSSNRIHIMDAASGAMLALFELGERHEGIAFADSDHLYVGSESGTLRVLTRDTSDNWSMQIVWQGNAAIRWLEASPRSRFLVVVDQHNLAQQFILGEGKLGEHVVQLSGNVEEVSFAPNGSRVLFRTSRWIHRASSAASGLIWLDAALAPRSIGAARMVFGDSNTDKAAPLGNRIYLPLAGDGFVQLVELNFDSNRGPALFGNRELLLNEWRVRLGID